MFHDDLANHKRRFTSHFTLWTTLLALCIVSNMRQPAHAAENIGGEIVFRSRGGLWTMNPDGSNQQSLDVEGDDPRWSPDGTQIVFTRVDDRVVPLRHFEIFVVNADGSDLRQLTDAPRGQQGSRLDQHLAAERRGHPMGWRLLSPLVVMTISIFT